MSSERRASHRGFASMDQDKQRRIASKGGRSVPNEKRSFSLDRRLAAEAGRKGGQASHAGTRKRPANLGRSGSSAAPERSSR